MALALSNADSSISKEIFAQRVRRFEQRLLDNMKDIFVPVHLCLGHERVAAEIYEYIRPEDWLFSHHRNHGHYLAKGGSEEKLWDEIMGLPTGLNGGFAGSQGISDASINFHASAIVGGLVGVAAGCAYALKMNESKAIAVCCIGDGGTEAGVFWEALNFCALYRLPIAYIIENNGMSVDAKIEERQATPLIPRVAAFGIRISGNVLGALQLARMGRPSFHEAKVKLECDHINMGALLPSEVI
jgi:TPP-dependent pyruvate/acetoin dehydrogenase alpha subunit